MASTLRLIFVMPCDANQTLRYGEMRTFSVIAKHLVYYYFYCTSATPNSIYSSSTTQADVTYVHIQSYIS